MKSATCFSTALLLAAGIGGVSGSAAADDAFLGCMEPHWTAFGDAVASGDADTLAAFLRVYGPNCPPLQQTAEVLFCEIDPAACLQAIEPAAGTPEEDIPEEPEEPEYDFAYRAPGEHLGWENDHSNGDGNDGPSGGSEPAGNSPPSGGGSDDSRDDGGSSESGYSISSD